MIKKALAILLITCSFLSSAQSAMAQSAVVRAVLFFSPTCPHCHQVMEYDLPPLQEKYGAQLDIAMIDVTTEQGYNLYLAAVEAYQIPQSRFGVPTLIVGDTVLVGSMEIPQLFPGLIEAALQKGGVDWPSIPGLKEVLIAQHKDISFSNPTEVENTLPLFMRRYLQDPLANTIALIILVGMLLSVVFVARLYLTEQLNEKLNWPKRLIPLLCVVGAGIAFYLTYVETTQQEAICGPVGDCNAVQKSPFSILFGFLPVGLLGLIGYILILITWVVAWKGKSPWKGYAHIAIWGMSGFGVLFSMYLTFLEPFIIGATCMWCIGSAIVITALLWSSTNPAFEALGIGNEKSDEDEEGFDVESEESEAGI